jgi:predicted branched-subunit amino acid permease
VAGVAGGCQSERVTAPDIPLTEDDLVRSARRAALRAAGVIVASYIPFGIAAGAAMGATSVDPLVSILSSPIIFAGAAQIAAVQLLHIGAALGIVVLTVAVINARHLLYSAALGPHLAEWTLGQRMGAAFLLADPVYALAAARFDVPIGIVVGGFIPEWVPFELAIPLTFLLLTLPLIKNRAGLVAAAVAGIVALVAHALPLGIGLMVGAVVGVAAGVVVLNLSERRDSTSTEEAVDA